MAASFTAPEMKEIFEGFLIENQELLDTLTGDLMEIEQNPDDDELINKIFRSFHTIKGTSSFMGVDKISTITHNAEDILNKVRRHEMSINQDIIDVMLEVQDWIQVMLEQLKAGEDIEADYSETLERLNILKTGASLSPQAAPQVQEISASQEKVVKDEDKGSALKQVLTNTNITSHPGDFTPDEYELLDKAFAEVNQKFAAEVKTQVSNTNEDKRTIDERTLISTEDE
ncbi:MAG: Hpt domain-containing protein, partial [Ignavibacteria bacterium]|nr:Hpt domain-containing protein [Ignavibacteria bacterium]